MNAVIEQDVEAVIASGLDWDRFANKTVLVTGAYGMLLSYMVWTLLRLAPRLNIKVIALVRSPEKAEERFRGFSGDHLQLVRHDLSGPVDVPGKVDFVIHGASYASPHQFSLNPSAVIVPNVMGTYHLLELARTRKPESFLYFSSGAVYGRPLSGEEVTEEYYGYLDPLDVRNCYGESKRMAENMCRCWQAQYGVPVKMVRPAHVYGPTMDIEHDSRVFASFVRNVIRGEDLLMRSDGSAKRSFCYSVDATVAFFKVLLDGQEGHAYNVGNDGCYLTIRGLAETFAAVFPGTEVVVKGVHGQASNADEKMLMVSTKLRELGWECAYSLEAGIKRTVESYRGTV